ncbi:uncharacterized mitochondrial protein AtMg00810-like [Telopea speciosissima]|uniref:uncharacterized mitochondrial protein AtMg00810-like n=1 Tax=Telopea speciosissima TaxID=54955 RepID=UPI001CC772C9|nr:uncharacterized mitochondrial protein AtMg00810-like [Telopea speciosissima]
MALTVHLTKIPPEPTSYKVASKNPSWVAAMDSEYKALMQNQTWTLVPPSKEMNIVGCKWVYRIKTKSDGSIERYKARLVAKGFHQQPGIDFTETFSPVVKPATIRTILSIAVSRAWHVKQLDVKNAFLHGNLNEAVYMHQPQGYVNPTVPEYVCHLNKALYGLRQAPRAWFHKFSNYLIQEGFRQSLADSSMFIYKGERGMIVLLLYVDDIIITGDSVDLIKMVVTRLSHNFAMTDLGDLHYFLGIEANRSSKGITLTQTKYALQLLERTGMTQCKPINTPMPSGHKLSTQNGEPLPEAHEYRQIVGALQYLTMTRPDLTYAVNQVCQYMHKPTTDHLAAVKRILRYVKGTVGAGTTIKPSSLNLLGAYTDADWAGCPDTRRSTSGFCTFLGSNLLSWGSKKQPTVSAPRSSSSTKH